MALMAEEYPRVLVDREVLLVRTDDRQRARLRGWLAGYDGPRPLYRIELLLGGNRLTATAMDMFESLVWLRHQLEPDGWMIAVHGARRDTYSSGMLRDMEVMRPGHWTSADDVVDTLADAAVDQLGTVAEQRAYWDAWIAEAEVKATECPLRPL